MRELFTAVDINGVLGSNAEGVNFSSEAQNGAGVEIIADNVTTAHGEQEAAQSGEIVTHRLTANKKRIVTMRGGLLFSSPIQIHLLCFFVRKDKRVFQRISAHSLLSAP